MIDKTAALGAQSVMDQIRAYQHKAQETRVPELQIDTAVATKPQFNEAVRALFDQVNQAQMEASNLRSAYERGEDIPLTDVVISMQKSSLAFEATLQVRNKVLKAYEDIMNMPV
ncbi:MAG: flagellar hook-basal body complex protein FliE [Gammaproteobacteria bacterium]|nr:flagellar hook-basal body complex protein FliE [Gammaproteobacteria bacterium]